MKKILSGILLLMMMAACSDSKKEKSGGEAGKETPMNGAASGNDQSLAAWLKDKKLAGKDTMMDYHNFKLYADGICEDKGGARVNWTVEDGKLNIGGMMKFAIDKKDDTTLVLHRSLSDEVYVVSAIR